MDVNRSTPLRILICSFIALTALLETGCSTTGAETREPPPERRGSARARRAQRAEQARAAANGGPSIQPPKIEPDTPKSSTATGNTTGPMLTAAETKPLVAGAPHKQTPDRLRLDPKNADEAKSISDVASELDAPPLAKPVPEKAGAKSVTKPNDPIPLPPAEKPQKVAAVKSPSAAAEKSRAIENNLTEVRRVLDAANAFVAKYPDYTCRVVRRERVGERLLPQETMQMTFRSKPRSVHYKWLDESNAGRQAVYVEGQNNGKIVSLGGKSDVLFVGKTMSVDPNGFLARGRSRYSITESGLDNMVRRLERVVRRQERNDVSLGKTEYQGIKKRSEWQAELHGIVQHIPPGADPAFPKGGIRHWYFDVVTGQMVIMHAETPKGEFIESYCFDRFTPHEKLTDASFDPQRLWSAGQKRENGKRERSAGREPALSK